MLSREDIEAFQQNQSTTITVDELIGMLTELSATGSGDVPVCISNSSSGATDILEGVHISTYFGEEGPFDLESNSYAALVGG